MRCPFMYSKGKRCTGQVWYVWQRYGKNRQRTWMNQVEQDDGEWVETDWYEVDLMGKPITGKGPHGKATSHLHIHCTMQGDHPFGEFETTDPQMKFWTFTEIERRCAELDKAAAKGKV